MSTPFKQIEQLIAAATQPGHDPSEATDELAAMLREAWAMLDFDQRRRLILCDASQNTLDCAFPNDDPETKAMAIADEMRTEIEKMELLCIHAGYSVLEQSGSYYWSNGVEMGEDFYSREDAIIDAHEDLLDKDQLRQNKPICPKG